MTSKEYKSRKRKYLGIFLIVVITVIVFWFFSEEILTTVFNRTAGSSFDMTTSLFSALSFAGVIFAILLQGLELEMQRHEIRNSSEQLEGQRKALELQNFEGAFFDCLGSQSEIVDRLNSRVTGFNYFDDIYRKFDEFCKKNGKEGDLSIYQRFFYQYDSEMGHYIRNLNTTLRMVLGKADLDNRKGFYVNLVRAGLSNDELRLLLYYTMSLFLSSDLTDDISESDKSLWHQLVREYDFFSVIRRKSLPLVYESDWGRFYQIFPRFN